MHAGGSDVQTQIQKLQNQLRPLIIRGPKEAECGTSSAGTLVSELPTSTLSSQIEADVSVLRFSSTEVIRRT